jgi:hypothetical protein
MPDLMIVSMQMCKSIDGPHTASVHGYTQYNLFSESHYPECTCPAYTYGKRTEFFDGKWYPERCKHIRQAAREACGWHEQFHLPVQNAAQKQAHICPRCGGPTVDVQVAV